MSQDKILYAKASLAIADIFSRELDPASAVETYKNIIESSPEFKRDAVELDRIKTERDFLREALAFFAKASK